MGLCTKSNIAERKFLGNLLLGFKPFIDICTKEWAETFRVLSSEESAIEGKFDCMLTPWMLYVMECLDNCKIPVIVGMKSAQIAWTETMNNHRGKRIHTSPCKMVVAFPRLETARVFYREKWRPFYTNTPVLRELINVNVAKESFNFFKFPGGFLKFITAGSVGAMKSSSIPYIEVEEPDDLKEDVNGQGDALKVLMERQKTFPVHRKKLIFGGTPTYKDFSKVEDAYKQSNRMVYKAKCHLCGELNPLSFDNLKVDEYQDRYIDEIYGRENPYSAYYQCPSCLGSWTFEEKNNNILEGLAYGNLGWHATRPDITDIYGFAFNELLSSFAASNFIELAKKWIVAKREQEKGKEGAIKSFVNNSMGLPYASGISAIESEELKLYRSNYPEHIVPMEGLVLTAGIDVQDNRFAVVIRAWGRNDCSWLVSWFEIWGDVKNEDDPVWQELTDKTVLAEVPHIIGKKLRIAAVSIDSGDNTELVYKWVLRMQEHNPQVFATKGVKDMRFTDDEVYREPAKVEVETYKQIRQTLAETMGVTVFPLGAHRAHTEILNRLALNANKNARSNIYYFNEQSYGQYEEQITSCRKIIATNSDYNKTVYKLIPGKRKEAMDAEKNALHAAVAIGIRNYTHAHWKAIEDYLKADICHI